MSSRRAPLSAGARSSTRSGSIGDTRTAAEIIESVAPGPNALPDPELPGHGDVYTEDDDHSACGVATTTRVCSSCGRDHEVGACCDRWECPRCYKKTVLDAATDATAKLATYRDNMGDGVYFHRVVISPPPDEDFTTSAADPLDRFYEVCGDLLDAGGALGGVQIPHPYRHADEPEIGPDADDRTLALVGGGDEGDDRGLWKHTLPDWTDDHTPDWTETDAKLSHEPHMHAYVAARSFWLPTAEIYDETGWIIKRLEPYEGNSVSCYGVEDLARSVMYALSHCGHYTDENGRSRKHYRYFGAVANEPTDEAQRDRMSRICRGRAGHVLGLPTSSVTCSADVSDADTDADAGGGGEALADEWAVDDVPGRADGEAVDDRGAGAGRADLPGAGDPGAFGDESTPVGDLPDEGERRAGGAGGSGGGGVPVTVDEDESDVAARESDESGESDGGEYEPCGGRLVHLRQLPDLLVGRGKADEWPDERVTHLREVYEAEYGEPPD